MWNAKNKADLDRIEEHPLIGMHNFKKHPLIKDVPKSAILVDTLHLGPDKLVSWSIGWAAKVKICIFFRECF